MQTGSTYQVTIDGETSTCGWPVELTANGRCWGSCVYYPRTVTWNLEARGYVEPPAVDEIQALVDEGYLRMRDISNRWNVPEELVGRIVERDDFPAAKVVGTRRLWLLQEVRTWFSQRQDR